MRLTCAKVFQTVQVFLLVIVIVAIGNPTLGVIALAIGGISSWPTVARLVRAEFRTLREADFVTAARSLGFGNNSIILREILPRPRAAGGHHLDPDRPGDSGGSRAGRLRG